MSVLNAALLCLALNAYYESRGEPLDGQIAVSQVVLRRAGMDPARVCREVYKPAQFSWTASRPRGSELPARTDPAWRRAQYAARIALLWASGASTPDYSNGATHYHADHVRPYWSRGKDVVAEVGRHRFYARVHAQVRDAPMARAMSLRFPLHALRHPHCAQAQ
jgi:spore germination cell wall hydrolase CwlJ-like protein